MLWLDGVQIEQAGFRLAADWRLDRGARAAVMGPSGAGKSTLLSVISGFLTPVSGRVVWEAEDLSDVPPGKRPLSILFQDQNLFPHLTISQNLALGLRPDMQLSVEEKARIDAVLERVGLAGLASRRPAQLSGGQMGRAALARALLRARPLLLLDEPFAALGPALKAEMVELVAEVAEETGATVLMVTHDPKDAQSFSSKTILVAEGLAHPPKETQALFADPPDVLKDYLGR
ncbi:thiamine ABC transporter ATP-binding protein [Thioclava sp. FR2]|uniref:thiamine ABC transporter ATP-binding protein n=1 Tax=Thioclava sp. FR2 TaxID=3445780 RepID=UPI003EB83BA6